MFRPFLILRSKRRVIISAAAGLLIVAYLSFFPSPPDFPSGQTITVAEGASVWQLAKDLAEQKIVRSPAIFRWLVWLNFSGDLVVAGDYYFGRPIGLLRVAGRLARGDYGRPPVKVTLPEGLTVKEMALLLSRILPGFDGAAFSAAAQSAEGYLFPDTYFFQPTVTPAAVFKILSDNFQTKIKPFQSAIDASGRSLKQIIIMASLLEEEAPPGDARRIIAGILWKRLDEGMPLQVDAVFPYILGKNTFALSQDDLATSSPYNTYRFRGLPPGPITNPGLDAITAALEPVATVYWYYLSDRSGQIHYAVDFDEHRVNKAKYLP